MPRLMIGIVLVLTLAAANAWQHWLKPQPMAPNLTLTTLKGKTLSLQQLQGKPILISFWATSCGICLSEVEDLIALHNAYQARGYQTIAIALSYDSLPRIQHMSINKPLPYFVAYDQRGDYAKAFGGVRMTPTHFLIAPDGRIVWSNIGPIDRKTIQDLIEPWLSAA